MTAQEAKQKFTELEYLLEQIMAKIRKVHAIMYHQDIDFLTHPVDKYRRDYLKNLNDHRRIVENQMIDLLDQVDIRDIIPSVYQE